MNALQNYKPTSKSSLKHFCLMATDCNLTEAEKLYNFLIKDITELPDFDPAPLSFMDKTKGTLDEIINFTESHKDSLLQAVDMVRGIFSKRSPVINNPLPPIN